MHSHATGKWITAGMFYAVYTYVCVRACMLACACCVCVRACVCLLEVSLHLVMSCTVWLHWYEVIQMSHITEQRTHPAQHNLCHLSITRSIGSTCPHHTLAPIHPIPGPQRTTHVHRLLSRTQTREWTIKHALSHSFTVLILLIIVQIGNTTFPAKTLPWMWSFHTCSGHSWINTHISV